MGIKSPESADSQGGVDASLLTSFIKYHGLNVDGSFRDIGHVLSTKKTGITDRLQKILNLGTDATTEEIQEAIKRALTNSNLKDPQGTADAHQLMSFAKENKINTGRFFETIEQDLAERGADVTYRLEEILNLKPGATIEEIRGAIKSTIAYSDLKPRI